MNTLLWECGIEHNLFELVIWEVNGVIQQNPVSMYVTAERADHDARRMSKLMPENVICLMTMARHKARYKNGERIMLADYNDYYSGLTPAEHKLTQIQDVNAEWV